MNTHGGRRAGAGRPQIRSDECRLIAKMYLAGWTIPRLAREFGKPKGWIYRRLVRMNVPRRHVGAKGIACVDCGKPIDRGKRCKFHVRVREAELHREYRRDRGAVPLAEY